MCDNYQSFPIGRGHIAGLHKGGFTVKTAHNIKKGKKYLKDFKPNETIPGLGTYSFYTIKAKHNIKKS